MEKPIVMTLDTTVFCDERKFNDAYNQLSDERRRKTDALCKEGDKRLSLGAGVLFENGLKNLGISDISLRYGENKKPYLASDNNLFFSLSHSGVMAACAFYDKEIGIDIEKIRKVPDFVIERVTAKAEYDYLSGLGEEKKLSEFIRLWTVKESYVKYLGEGINALPPKKLEMTFCDNITLTCGGKAIDVIIEEQAVDGYMLTLCYGK